MLLRALPVGVTVDAQPGNARVAPQPLGDDRDGAALVVGDLVAARAKVDRRQERPASARWRTCLGLPSPRAPSGAVASPRVVVPERV